MTKPKLAIIGAGKLGITLAQLATQAHYPVSISGSGNPSKIELSINILAPGATAMTTESSLRQADVIILALPLSSYAELDPEWFPEHTPLIDATNYWWETDGRDQSLASPPVSTSEIIQNHLPHSRVTKALSHVGYHDLRDFSTQNSQSQPISIALAGPIQDRDILESLIADLGFEPYYLGELPEGRRLEPGSPVFGAHLTKQQLIAALANG